MKSIKRKGVSPIISVLLLILIAVAAGVMTYVFVAGWIGSATTSTTVVQGQLSVDYADANATTTPGNLTIYLRNVGGVALTIDRIYVEKAGGGLVKEYTPSPTLTLNPGDVEKVSFNVNLTAGEVYTIRIATKEGTTIVFSVKAHS